MTTERPPLRRLALALSLALGGWIATLAAVSYLSDAAPAQFVLLPPGDILARLPEAQLLDAGPGWVVLASETGGLARAAWRAGGLLVLPAGLRGCLG